MQALGISLQEGFSKFLELGDSFAENLQNPEEGTTSEDLKQLIDAFSDSGWLGQTTSLTTEATTSMLQQGKQVVALVAIDTDPSQEGSVSSTGDIAHWVHITKIENGNVTYYNPYVNSSQSVSVEQFNAAWESTPGNNSSFTAVVASQ
jgi:hypothetical protein